MKEVSCVDSTGLQVISSTPILYAYLGFVNFLKLDLACLFSWEDILFWRLFNSWLPIKL